MIHYRVENLDALLAAPRAEGVEIDPRREDYDYSRFAWILDPKGNRIELWEPPKTRVRTTLTKQEKPAAKNAPQKSNRSPALASRNAFGDHANRLSSFA